MIVNSLIGSLFVYKMSVLPKIPPTFIKNINAMIEKFIWKCRKPKIKTDILMRDKRDGGLRLISLETRYLSQSTMGCPLRCV